MKSQKQTSWDTWGVKQHNWDFGANENHKLNPGG